MFEEMQEETDFWNYLGKFTIVIGIMFMIILVNTLIISINFYINFLAIILIIIVFVAMLFGFLLISNKS
jgi:ATP/ADP translocase